MTKPYKEVSAAVAVSFVIPAYQAEATIVDTLRSVLSVCDVPIEAIVVDDGSTDGTARLLDNVAARDPRVRALHQPNAGRSSARNVGIAAARGEWVMFVDSDDRLLPSAPDLIASAVQQAKTDLVVFGVRIQGDEKLERWASAGDDRYSEGLIAAQAGALADAMVRGGWSDVTPGSRHYEQNACWARLYRRESLSSLGNGISGGWGPFPEGLRFSEDRLLNLAYLRRLGDDDVEFCPSPVYLWDLRLSGTVSVVRAEDTMALAEYRKRLGELVEAGVMEPDELAPMFAREVAQQFRRGMLALPPEGPRTSELVQSWEKVLAAEGERSYLSAVPEECLGDHQVWLGAMRMLSRGHVRHAVLLYRLMIHVKKLLNKTVKRGD